MPTGTQNPIYSNQNWRPLHVRDTFLFERGNVAGFAHTGGEAGAASVVGPSSTPGGFPDAPFVIGVYTTLGEAAQPGNIRPIDSEILLNYPGSVSIQTNPTGIDGNPTAANQNTAASSIAAVRGCVTIGGVYTVATPTPTDPSRVTATTLAGGYAYGVQGKFIVAGTFNDPNYSAALVGQLDLSHAVAVSTQAFAALWLDAGASFASAAQASVKSNVSLVNLTQTNASGIHAIFNVVEAYADFLFDINSPTSGVGALVATTAGAAAAAFLNVKVNGVAYKLQLLAVS